MKKLSKLKKYEIAIDAKKKLTDDFHKWMTFYYVANSGILLAIVALLGKSNGYVGVLSLSIIALFVSIFWNLSCKGYSYWSNSWMKIIFRLEKKLIKDKKDGVYSVFSKEVRNKHDSIIRINQPANISTPKLSLIFSFLSILCWLIFSLYIFNCCIEIKLDCVWLKPIISVFVSLTVALLYYDQIPRWTRSKVDICEKNDHTLV